MLKHTRSLLINQKGKNTKNLTDTEKKADFMLHQKKERYFTDLHVDFLKKLKIRSYSKPKEKQKIQDLDPVNSADLKICC